MILAELSIEPRDISEGQSKLASPLVNLLAAFATIL